MSIEKALRNYLDGNGPKVKNHDLFHSIEEDNSNAIINVLFKLVNEDVDDICEAKTTDRDVEVLKYVELLLKNNDGVNRKIVARKLLKLYEKLDRVVSEGRKKFVNVKKIESEFNKIRREIDVLMELNEEKDTKQYDFISFLVLEMKDISYLEYAFSKVPTLTNVKDKDEVPLYRNIIRSFLLSIDEENEEDIFYFQNLLQLIQSQQSFDISNTEKKACLEEIYKFINKLSYNKKAEKKNHKKIEFVSSLVEQVKGIQDDKSNIEDIASQYDIHIYFDPLQIEEAKLVKTPMNGSFGDRKVVDDYTVSIDKADAIEIDDLLSCKKLSNGNLLLGVHIASVLGYFPYESDIVQEAIHRNQAIYMPQVYQSNENDFCRTIPLFPYDFAADKGSLKEGEKRLARSYYFEIDKDGNVVDEHFYKTIVVNNKKLTYDEANKIISKGVEDKKLNDTIKNLEEVAKRIEKNYRGTELYEKVKENTDDVSELRVKKVGSQNIVYQAMLLTGNRVADYCYSHGYPCLYRVHEVNEENNRKLQDMIETLNATYSGEQFKNLYKIIESIYPKGWYGIEGRHSGLDIDHYCHCTSLLRRAADIIMEHVLEVCYDKTPTEEELEELRNEISNRCQEINSKQSSIDYFVKEYQKKHRR